MRVHEDSKSVILQVMKQVDEVRDVLFIVNTSAKGVKSYQLSPLGRAR